MDYEKIIIDLLNRIVTLEERVAKLENSGNSTPGNSSNLPAKSKKYRSLSDYLSQNDQPRIRLSFDEIQQILNRELPDSAFAHRAFWANTTSHAIALSWLGVNYAVEEVSLEDKYIVFKKGSSDMPIHDQLRTVVAELISKFGTGYRVSKRELYDLLGDRFQTKCFSIIPSDYCYDRVNKGIDFMKKPRLFSYIEDGMYACLGEDYPFSGDVYAQEKGSKEAVVVGTWENGVLTKNENWVSCGLK